LPPEAAQFYETRDLKPATDLHAAAKGARADYLGVSVALLGASVFANSACIALSRASAAA
jgi:uncharacterized protein (DUF1501 family)